MLVLTSVSAHTCKCTTRECNLTYIKSVLYDYFHFYLYVAPPVTDGIIIACKMIDNIIIVYENATRFEATGTISNLNANFTIKSNRINDPEVMVENNDTISTIPSPSDASDVTTVMAVNQTSEYNMAVICSFHYDNEADMVEVIARSDEGINKSGNICILYFVLN